MEIKFTNASLKYKKQLFMFTMKAVFFLWSSLFFGLVPSHLVSQTSKITISQNKIISVDEVFDLVISQTDYNFIYKEGLFDHYPKVKIKKGTIKTNDLLDKILSKNKFDIKVLSNNFIAIKEKIVANNNPIQKITITGKVTDNTGHPLPGANILEKGTTNGVQTNFDGLFTITVNNENAIITVSFLGYKTQETKINNQKNINIVLTEDISGLEEVVVVGYGTTKKQNLTSAVNQVKTDELGNRANTSIVQSLQGIMPGLNIQSNNGDPRENAEINVRGFNSINGGSPLVLIDGIAGNINLINPADVETVTVLKDAGSAAIYGARGAFGVILVTTKKGKKGRVKVDFNSSTSMASPTVRTDYISDPVLYGKTIDAAIYGYNGGNYTGYTSNEDWERLQLVADGVVAPWQELQADGSFKFYGNTDWYDYLYRKTVFSKVNDVAISGGNETVQAYLSGRIYKTGTVQKLQDEEVVRKNIKTNVSLKINNWLNVSHDVQYNTGNQNQFGGRSSGWGLGWTYDNNYLYAFDPVEIDGVPFDRNGQSTIPSVLEGNSFRDYKYKQIVNTFSTIITPLDNLKINIDYSNRFENRDFTQRLNEFSRLTSDELILRTTGLNRLIEQDTEIVYNVLNAYTTYNQKIGASHSIKLVAGYNQEDYSEDLILAEQGGLFDPSFSNLNLGTELIRADASSENWAVQGIFGRLHYDFNNKYLVDFTARYDGSSRFPENSRFGFFPSISAGWFVDKENFWTTLKSTLSTFKLRGSYGVLGNQNVDLYTFSQLLPIGNTSWLQNGAELNYVSSPTPLPETSTWENAATTNLGIDLGLFKNKFMASVDVYKKEITDMYLPGEPLPGVFGASEPRENSANLQVTGFEVSVSYQNSFTLKNKTLKFKFTGSLNNSQGKITKYSNPNGLLSSFYEGQVLGEIWGYHVDGQFQSDEEATNYQNSFVNPSSNLSEVYNFALNVAQNNEFSGLKAGDLKYLDLDGDGRIDGGNNTLEDHGDLRVIGNAMPKFPFGFLINTQWNGFDFMTQGAGVVSQDWYPTGRLYWGTYERPYVAYIRKDLVSNAWSENNPNGIYPQINRSYTALVSNRQLGAVNNHYLTNLGYLRIKNLTLGYTLPQDITRKISIERLRLYLSGENIFTFRFGNLTKYLDPEQAGSGVNMSNPNTATTRSRVEDYPINKIFSLGINISL